MNERDFYYWLQGFFELSGAKELNKRQVKMIKEHMELVTNKVTETSVEEQSGQSESMPEQYPFEEDIDKIMRRISDVPSRKVSDYPGRDKLLCNAGVDHVCKAPKYLTY